MDRYYRRLSGETEKDFEEKVELVKKAKPDFVNVSQFGPRPGTPAKKMEQVSGDVKKERSKKLSELLKQIYLENNKKWMGWEGKVLVAEMHGNKVSGTPKAPLSCESKTGFLGKNFAYKPVQINNSKDILGKYVNVKITKASSSALSGEIIG